MQIPVTLFSLKFVFIFGQEYGFKNANKKLFTRINQYSFSSLDRHYPELEEFYSYWNITKVEVSTHLY